MKNTKKAISLIVAVLMLLACIPLSGAAKPAITGTTDDGLEYCVITAENGKPLYTVIMGYSGSEPAVAIPDEIYYNDESDNYYLPVLSIASGAFENNTSIIYVNIGKNVNTIFDCAFKGCTSLFGVYFDDITAEIGESAFENCTSLSLIYFPSDLKTIGDSAFKGCTSLTYIDLPEGVTYLGNNACENCTALEMAYIPSTVTSAMTDTFKNVNEQFRVIALKSASAISKYANDNGFTFSYSEDFIEKITVSAQTHFYRLGADSFDYEGTTAILYPTDNEMSWPEPAETFFYVHGFNDIGTYGKHTVTIEYYGITCDLTLYFFSRMADERWPGDVDENGTVNIIDVRKLLTKIANEYEFSEDEKVFADVDYDGNVTIIDARIILTMIAEEYYDGILM